MDIGVYKGAAALSAYEKWQDSISQNLAAASVPGFKKNEMAFSTVSSDGVKGNSHSHSAETAGSELPQSSAKINFTQGDVRHTGGDFDFAIQGSGFFQVQKANGDLGYTRDGEFQVSADRTLITKQGQTVMGESGPITLKPGGGPISINAEGMIFQRDQPVAKLPVYEFKEPQKLKRMGDGLLGIASGGEQPARPEKPTILSGFIENSNVSPMTEMVNLITVSRAYEACQKLIQTHDENSDKAIQILGSPTA